MGGGSWSSGGGVSRRKRRCHQLGCQRRDERVAIVGTVHGIVGVAAIAVVCSSSVNRDFAPRPQRMNPPATLADGLRAAQRARAALPALSNAVESSARSARSAASMSAARPEKRAARRGRMTTMRCAWSALPRSASRNRRKVAQACAAATSSAFGDPPCKRAGPMTKIATATPTNRTNEVSASAI